MWHLAVPLWELIARSLLIYGAFLVALRLFGKRQLGQFTVYDLAMLLLAANTLQPAMTGPDNSLTGGLVITGTLFTVNWIVAQLASRHPRFRRLLEPPPTILARDGQWDVRALAREGIDLDEALAAVHRAGLTDVSEAALVMLEPDGSITVVPKRRRR